RGATAPANDCSFYPNVGTTGVYASADGLSWTNRGMLPGFTDGNPAATLVSGGDPVISYGPTYLGNGVFSRASGTTPASYTAYYASLASYATGKQKGNQFPELITVSRSTNDGATWADPVVAADGRGHIFNDKESIWADANPASRFYGRVYVSWTQFRSNSSEPIRLTYSADGGRTWSVPTQLSPAYNNGTLNGRQGSTIRTGPDGAVYVAWEDTDKQGSIQVIAVSYDGGVSFTKPFVAGRVHDIADPIGGANFRTDSFASLAVSQRTGPSGYPLYLAYTSVGSSGAGEAVVRTATSRSLSSWSGGTVSVPSGGYAFFAAADVAPNGRVDVAWQAQTQTNASDFGTGNATIHSWYTSAQPGGAFATPAIVDTATTNDPAASSQNNLQRQFWGDYNTLVSTVDSAYFIYTDARHGTGCASVDAYQHDLSSPKPVPCSTTFGDTDIFVSRVTP
ncbi:MAG: glycoside hydrolase, partial [Actinomycetota bacterium]|nr:glycoside hydrolase [Actinomycetota bacterium]